MKKAVILARVSTLRQEKEGLSLKDIQLPKLREYAQENGYEVVQEFVFSESADSKIRTKFLEMISFVKSRVDIEAIIAYRVDRVTRNYRDAVLIDDLRLEHNKEIHFVYDRLVISQKTVGHVITDWDTKVFLAKQVLNRLKEDAHITSDRKLAMHEWPSRAPFGYKNGKNDQNNSWVFIDDTNARVVAKIFEWYATGSYSMLEISQKVYEVFGLKMVKSAVERVLKNSFYCGTMIYDGTEHQHNYDRIISESLFQKVKNVREGYRKKPFKFAGLPFAYRGLIRCADCGCIITPEKKTKKSGKSYHYYHCTQYNGKHGAEWLSEAELTRQFKEAFSHLQMPQRVVNDILMALKGSHQDKKYFTENLRQEYQTQYNKLQHRIEAMYDDKLDGSITESLYDKKRNEFRAEQQIIENKLARLRTADEEYYLTAQYLVQIASRAKELFEGSELEEKRLLLKLTLQNLQLVGKKIRYDWQKPFDKIAFYSSQPAWLPD